MEGVSQNLTEGRDWDLVLTEAGSQVSQKFSKLASKMRCPHWLRHSVRCRLEGPSEGREKVDGTDLHARPAIHRSRSPSDVLGQCRRRDGKKNQKPRKEIENHDRNFRTNGRTIVAFLPQRSSAVITISAAYWVNRN